MFATMEKGFKMTDFEKRIYALVQVGKYVSVEAMLSEIKNDEAKALWDWTRLMHANTHGLPQETEMKVIEAQNIGRVLGLEYLTEIESYCLKLIEKGVTV